MRVKTYLHEAKATSLLRQTLETFSVLSTQNNSEYQTKFSLSLGVNDSIFPADRPSSDQLIICICSCFAGSEQHKMGGVENFNGHYLS